MADSCVFHEKVGAQSAEPAGLHSFLVVDPASNALRSHAICLGVPEDQPAAADSCSFLPKQAANVALHSHAVCKEAEGQHAPTYKEAATTASKPAEQHLHLQGILQQTRTKAEDVGTMNMLWPHVAADCVVPADAQAGSFQQQKSHALLLATREEKHNTVALKTSVDSTPLSTSGTHRNATREVHDAHSPPSLVKWLGEQDDTVDCLVHPDDLQARSLHAVYSAADGIRRETTASQQCVLEAPTSIPDKQAATENTTVSSISDAVEIFMEQEAQAAQGESGPLPPAVLTSDNMLSADSSSCGSPTPADVAVEVFCKTDRLNAREHKSEQQLLGPGDMHPKPQPVSIACARCTEGQQCTAVIDLPASSADFVPFCTDMLQAHPVDDDCFFDCLPDPASPAHSRKSSTVDVANSEVAFWDCDEPPVTPALSVGAAVSTHKSAPSADINDTAAGACSDDCEMSAASADTRVAVAAVKGTCDSVEPTDNNGDALHTSLAVAMACSPTTTDASARQMAVLDSKAHMIAGPLTPALAASITASPVKAAILATQAHAATDKNISPSMGFSDPQPVTNKPPCFVPDASDAPPSAATAPRHNTVAERVRQLHDTIDIYFNGTDPHILIQRLAAHHLLEIRKGLYGACAASIQQLGEHVAQQLLQTQQGSQQEAVRQLLADVDPFAVMEALDCRPEIFELHPHSEAGTYAKLNVKGLCAIQKIHGGLPAAGSADTAVNRTSSAVAPVGLQVAPLHSSSKPRALLFKAGQPQPNEFNDGHPHLMQADQHSAGSSMSLSPCPPPSLEDQTSIQEQLAAAIHSIWPNTATGVISFSRALAMQLAATDKGPLGPQSMSAPQLGVLLQALYIQFPDSFPGAKPKLKSALLQLNPRVFDVQYSSDGQAQVRLRTEVLLNCADVLQVAAAEAGTSAADCGPAQVSSAATMPHSATAPVPSAPSARTTEEATVRSVHPVSTNAASADSTISLSTSGSQAAPSAALTMTLQKLHAAIDIRFPADSLQSVILGMVAHFLLDIRKGPCGQCGATMHEVSLHLFSNRAQYASLLSGAKAPKAADLVATAPDVFVVNQHEEVGMYVKLKVSAIQAAQGDGISNDKSAGVKHAPGITHNVSHIVQPADALMLASSTAISSTSKGNWETGATHPLLPPESSTAAFPLVSASSGSPNPAVLLHSINTIWPSNMDAVHIISRIVGAKLVDTTDGPHGPYAMELYALSQYAASVQPSWVAAQLPSIGSVLAKCPHVFQLEDTPDGKQVLVRLVVTVLMDSHMVTQLAAAFAGNGQAMSVVLFSSTSINQKASVADVSIGSAQISNSTWQSKADTRNYTSTAALHVPLPIFATTQHTFADAASSTHAAQQTNPGATISSKDAVVAAIHATWPTDSDPMTAFARTVALALANMETSPTGPYSTSMSKLGPLVGAANPWASFGQAKPSAKLGGLIALLTNQHFTLTPMPGNDKLVTLKIASLLAAADEHSVQFNDLRSAIYIIWPPSMDTNPYVSFSRMVALKLAEVLCDGAGTGDISVGSRGGSSSSRALPLSNLVQLIRPSLWQRFGSNKPDFSSLVTSLCSDVFDVQPTGQSGDMAVSLRLPNLLNTSKVHQIAAAQAKTVASLPARQLPAVAASQNPTSSIAAASSLALAAACNSAASKPAAPAAPSTNPNVQHIKQLIDMHIGSAGSRPEHVLRTRVAHLLAGSTESMYGRYTMPFAAVESMVLSSNSYVLWQQYCAQAAAAGISKPASPADLFYNKFFTIFPAPGLPTNDKLIRLNVEKLQAASSASTSATVAVIRPFFSATSAVLAPPPPPPPPPPPSLRLVSMASSSSCSTSMPNSIAMAANGTGTGVFLSQSSTPTSTSTYAHSNAGMTGTGSNIPFGNPQLSQASSSSHQVGMTSATSNAEVLQALSTAQDHIMKLTAAVLQQAATASTGEPQHAIKANNAASYASLLPTISTAQLHFMQLSSLLTKHQAASPSSPAVATMMKVLAAVQEQLTQLCMELMQPEPSSKLVGIVANTQLQFMQLMSAVNTCFGSK